MKVASRREVASVIVNLERREQVWINLSFENVFNRSNTFHGLNITDETRGYNSAEVSEFPVSRTFLD